MGQANFAKNSRFLGLLNPYSEPLRRGKLSFVEELVVEIVPTFSLIKFLLKIQSVEGDL